MAGGKGVAHLSHSRAPDNDGAAMIDHPPRYALGLMSGTSLDGIDIALIRSDGEGAIEPGPWAGRAYEVAFRDHLRSVVGGAGDVAAVQRDLTDIHANMVNDFLEKHDISNEDIYVIGFHGHTIAHRPTEALTWQIGDGALLAERTGIDVICDFRGRDVAAGGQGAPLAPLYHAALADGLERPLAVLNIGGVANLTWLGDDGAIVAFDTGPGGAMIDDGMRRLFGRPYDASGARAARGRVEEVALDALLDDPYIAAPPPKSLDRDAFAECAARALAGLAAADAIATLTAFTAAAVARAVAHLPAAPRRWIVTGGGRRNDTLMRSLAEVLAVPVVACEAVGWAGDAIEAQAFAYLALRARRGLAITLPATTGAPRPLTGGALHRFAVAKPPVR